MTNMCLYFQVHQPYRLRHYTMFDIGKKDYYDEKKNKEVLRKVAKKCYIPANKTIKRMIAKDDVKVAYSISGTAIEQFKEYSPSVLTSFQELADTGNVEMLNETYYHSLSFLHDKKEFREQVKQHRKLIRKEFNQKPKIFRNTELIYNNELAREAEKMGYKGVITEGWDPILGWRSPNFVYKAKDSKVKLLLKNYKLSDDIAFRFGNKKWEHHPLTAQKFTDWAAPIMGDTINLFMDYETFGEHQWEDTGIFEFLKHLPRKLKERNIRFHKPSELLKVKPKDELDIHEPISWADMERDTSAWLGNKMQQSAAKQLYEMKDKIKRLGREAREKWKKLTTSDHYYYMCTKWFADGDVHKYFNPYDSPYECYMNFMNVLQDMEKDAKQKTIKRLLGLKI